MSGKLNNGVFEERLRKDTSNGSDSDFMIKFAFVAQIPEGDDAGKLQATAAATHATEAIGILDSTPTAADLLASTTDAGTTIVTAVQAFETTWGVLLHRLELFDKIATDTAAIHPYASMTLSVISATNMVLTNQKNCDGDIIRLVGAMTDVFSFVDDADLLKKIKKHEETITFLLQQVTECGYFIMDYIKPNSFWLRTAKYAISDINARIAAYENKLRELQAAFLGDVALQTGLTFVRMVDVVQNIVESIDLNDMPYAEARYVQEKGCLPGTRESLLREICDILNDPAEDAPRVCLLTGLAGSGKSAVAHSIARLYDEQERLASSYCFSSTDVKRRNPQNLFSTIARDLCDHDPCYKSALWEIVKNNRALRTSTSPLEQVERFIVKPSRNLGSLGPQLVVIIDALDESGNRANRRVLLEAISKQITNNALPRNLCFLITARPESDILAKLGPSPHLVHIQIGHIAAEVVDGDSAEFIHRLDEYSEFASSSAKQELCRVLAHHVFQWAATACRVIQEDGLNQRKQIDLLLRDEGNSSVRPFDRLYQTILAQLFPSDDSQKSFCGVFARKDSPLRLRGWTMDTIGPLSQDILRDADLLLCNSPSVLGECEVYNKYWIELETHHIRNRIEESEITCQWGACGYRLKIKEIKIHLVHAHDIKSIQKLFKCLWNGCPSVARMISLSGLWRHVRECHCRAYKWPCTSCGVKFTREETLRKHFEKCSTCKKLQVVPQG